MWFGRCFFAHIGDSVQEKGQIRAYDESIQIEQTDEEGDRDMSLLLFIFLTVVYLPLGIIFKLAKRYM